MPLPLLGQQAPLFETTIWFTDAVGNTDSIVIGYDPESKWDSLNPQFGEEWIETPFDSIFEVRVSHETNWFSGLDYRSFLKNKITKAYPINWDNACFDTPPLGIYIYAKHHPVTVRWDMLAYQHVCRTHSWLALHETMVHIFDWHLVVPDVMNYTQCLAEDSLFVVPGPDDTWEWYGKYTVNLNNDTTGDASVMVVRHLPLSWNIENPCLGIVSTENLIGQGIWQFYPNPASNNVYLTLDGSYVRNGEVRVRLVHPSGMEVYRGFLSSFVNRLEIPSFGLARGLYIVELTDESGFILGVEKLILQ